MIQDLRHVNVLFREIDLHQCCFHLRSAQRLEGGFRESVPDLRTSGFKTAPTRDMFCLSPSGMVIVQGKIAFRFGDLFPRPR